MSYTKEDVWKYHAEPRPGKVEVLPSKRGETQDDLTLAYSPGVADACRAIEADPAAAASLTARSNLVAVVSNGTAVLGLGNIGPLAGKPVMEGKGMLFKMFADVDVFDLELATTDPDELINVVKTLEPTFGGINLEDIKAPECFYIEQKLKEIMNIPVFHDDQHGTAVISGAGLINAAHIAGRKMEDMKVVVVGAGAAGIACANFYVSLGVKRENIWMFDSKGLIHKGRQDKLHPTKAAFAQEKDATLAEAMQGAHVFLGLSKPGLVTQDMVRSMASHPVIFACANPVPEITYAEAKAARDDLLMGTGRSDCPNQINNVSGFPFIFRGALDVQATEINEAMKLAAAEALAMLAREDVPEEVSKAYGGKKFSFGPDYIIPSPLDPRIIDWVTPAVARAAMESGVARARIEDLDAYRAGLRERVARMRRRADAARLANEESSGRSRCSDRTGRQPPPLFSWPERSGIPDMARHNATRPPEAAKPFSLTTDIPLASGERTGHSGAKKEFPHGRHHRQISRRPAREMRAPAERYRARHRCPQGQQRQGRGLLPHRPLRHGPGRLRHDHHRHLRPEPRRGRDRHHHRDQQDHERQPAPHRQDRDHLQHARP